jgi:glycosyltransferase involved in cell wall biosynthesis
MTLPKKNKKEYDLISISHYFPPRVGGLENMAYTLLNELSKKGIRCLALFGSDEEYEKKEDGFKRISFNPVSIFDNTYPIFGLEFFFKTFKIIKENPNAKILIHSRHLTSSLLTHFVCGILSRPYTVVEHNAGRVYMKSKLATKIINWLDQHIFGYVLSGAQDIIAVSKIGKRWISRNFNVENERIKVIQNGYDLDNVEKEDLDQKENIVVWASKWIQVKNPQLVLKAYLQLAQKNPDWLFMLIGEGSALKYKRGNLPKNVRIIEEFLKHKDFISLLEKSKIYINSSFSEGLAIANLEAIAMGNIPVFSNAPSNKEVAKRVGARDFVFKRNNIKDLVKKIESAISKSQDRELVEKMIEKNKKHFSKEKMIENYYEMLLPEHYENKNLKEISIVVPVYNEEKTVSKIIKKLAKLKFPKDIKEEIVIVNDASTDKSLQFINETTKQKYKNTKFVVLENRKNKGKSQTVKKGILHSTGDLVVVQDADLEYDPKDLVKFVNIFLSNPHLDVIYGNRFNKKNDFNNLVHSLGNKLVTLISNLFTGPNGFAPKDMETCYKMVRGDIMRAIFKSLESTSNFGLEPELTAKLARYRKFNGNKLKFKVVDIYYEPRKISEGKKMKWFKHGFEAFLEILYFNTNPFTLEEIKEGKIIKRKF